MFGGIPNRDIEGNLVFRNQLACDGLYFKPRSITFETGKYQSLKNRSSTLADLGDCEMHFFDDDLSELIKGEEEEDSEFQNRLDLNCRFTWVYFTPTSQYAARIGEIAHFGTTPSELVAWFERAPHIPKASGGSVACADGGIPLHLLPSGQFFKMDGGTCALVDIDEVYYSHRVGTKIYHALNEHIPIVAVFGIYS